MKTNITAIKISYLWLFLFSAVPIGIIFFVSFLTPSQNSLVTLPLTLKNYFLILTPSFLKITTRSIFIGGMSTLLCLMLGYPFSYLLVRSKYQSIWMILIIIPFWTSSLVRTYALLALLKYNGMINLLLIKLHIIDTPLELLYQDFAVIAGLSYNLFPFMVLPIFSQMERFDFQLIQAAQDLGANKLAIFFKVFLPNTLPGIISGCLMVFLPAMTLFYIPDILGGARSILLGNLIQTQFLVLQNWPQGSAISALLTLFLLLMLFLFRKSNRGQII